MNVASKTFTWHYGKSLLSNSLKYFTYPFVSGSSQEIRKDLQPSEQRFDEVAPELRTKQTFLKVVDSFSNRRIHARGHVEFIKSALKYMKEYGLQRDLDVYKSLLNVFPKGPLIPQNIFQFHRFLPHRCGWKIKVTMRDAASPGDQPSNNSGVQPDKEIHDLVVNIFGEWNFATKKVKRMMYWMPKLKHSNTYLDRRKIEGKNLSTIDLGYLALKMISRDPGTQITFVKTEDKEIEESERWLLSAQSPLQTKLLQDSKQNCALYVIGPNRVYLMNYHAYYVGLFADPKIQYYEKYGQNSELDEDFENWKSEWDGDYKKSPECNIHEQQHETVLALSVFGKVCRETAAAWINHLQKSNPVLHNARVLFRIKQNDGMSVVQIS